MPKPSYSIQLSPEEKRILNSILRLGTVEARHYRRAKMLLLKAEGMPIRHIAEKLDVTISTVRLCLDKFREGGIGMAIEDLPGRGRKTEITEEAKQWMLGLARQDPKSLGLHAEVWSATNLTRYVNLIAEEAGFPRMSTVTVPTVRTILNQYCRDSDPESTRYIKKCKQRPL